MRNMFDLDLIGIQSGLVKGTAKAPDILEEDTETMFSTNVTGLINMTQVGCCQPLFTGPLSSIYQHYLSLLAIASQFL